MCAFNFIKLYNLLLHEFKKYKLFYIYMLSTLRKQDLNTNNYHLYSSTLFIQSMCGNCLHTLFKLFFYQGIIIISFTLDKHNFVCCALKMTFKSLIYWYTCINTVLHVYKYDMRIRQIFCTWWS